MTFKYIFNQWRCFIHYMLMHLNTWSCMMYVISDLDLPYQCSRNDLFTSDNNFLINNWYFCIIHTFKYLKYISSTVKYIFFKINMYYQIIAKCLITLYISDIESRSRPQTAISKLLNLLNTIILLAIHSLHYFFRWNGMNVNSTNFCS